ncbi:hypothetical protein MCBRY_001629 [Methylocystis bryophila]
MLRKLASLPPLALLMSAAISNASAGTLLPSAQWTGSRTWAQGSDGSPADNQSVSHSISGPGSSDSHVVGPMGSGTSTLTQSGFPGPSIQASVSGSAITVDNGHENTQILLGAYSELTYWIEILGPASVSSTQIKVSGSGYANMTGNNGAAESQLRILFGYNPNGINSTFQNYTFEAYVVNSASSKSFAVNGLYTAPVNVPFEVVLDANAEVNASVIRYTCCGWQSNTPVYANSFVDPYFSLPTDLANSGLYSIITSSGIGNSPLGAPGPTPGAGLAGLAALTLAARYARTRRA